MLNLIRKTERWYGWNMQKSLPRQDMENIFSYYENNGLDFRSSSFLISGATGFVGSWLTESLINLDLEFNLGLSIACICRDISKANELYGAFAGGNLRIIEDDIRRIKQAGGEFSHVIHAATPTTTGSRAGDLENVYESSVLGAQNLINLLQGSSPPPIFLHTSSGAVYGRQPADLARFPLSFPVWSLPLSNSVQDQYMRAKIDTEIIVAEANTENRVRGINARLFAFMGPRLPLNEHYAIGNFLSTGIFDGVVKVRGDGKSVRSYQYVADMACNLLFLLSNGIAGTYHVGSSDGYELIDWARVVADICGTSVSVLHEETAPATRYVPESDPRIPQGPSASLSRVELLSRWHSWIKEGDAPLNSN